MDKELIRAFGNKVRTRASGICIRNNAVLLVKHKTLGKKGILWAPPGGEVIFGETALETVKREFVEETGLLVEPGRLLLVNEYIEKPLHAIELFFTAQEKGGELQKGTDPEISEENQIISEVRFIPFSEISGMDPDIVHSLFRKIKSEADLTGNVLFMQNIVL